MKYITLTHGYLAKVDDEDYPKLSQFKWRRDKAKMLSGYAVTGHKRLAMHNMLLNPGKLEVDHIDGDGLNNCRDNLRLATRAQQCQNRKQSSYKSSRFKGVRWWKIKQIWQARIKKDGKEKHLGYFQDELLAAHAYDKAAKELFGEYAKTNF